MTLTAPEGDLATGIVAIRFTQTNLGAYYLSAGDRLKVKVGKAVEGGYEAELITR